MAMEQEYTLLHELSVANSVVSDIDVTLKGTPEDFGPPKDLNLDELGEIIESRAFFDARREEIIRKLAGESLMAATHAA